MKIWWQSLMDREKALLGGGATILVLAALYLTLLEPMAKQENRLGNQLIAEEAVLTRLQTNAKTAIEITERKNANPGAVSKSTGSLLSIINRTTATHGLTSNIKRISPAGSDQVTIAIESTPFDEMTKWLIALQTQHAVFVKRINVDKEAVQGLVRANLTLAR